MTSKVIRINEAEQSVLEQLILASRSPDPRVLLLYHKVKQSDTPPRTTLAVDWKDHSHDNETPETWERGS
jgi:hypothetical protein